MTKSNLTFEELLLVLEEVRPIVQVTTTTIAAKVNNPTKAPGRFPYPLDTIMEELAGAYLQLHNAKSKLHQASTDNIALSISQRDKLYHLRNKMKYAAKITRDVAEELENSFT